jgi:hypothetical protein
MMAAARLGAAFAGNFQAAWYLTIICVFGLAVTAWGVYQVARTLRAMWREGDILLFATVVSLVAVVILFFGSLIAMVLISLGPPVGGS